MSKDTFTQIASAKIVHDNRKGKQNKEGKNPLCIRVIYNRQNILYTIGQYLTVDEFKQFEKGKSTNFFKELRKVTTGNLERANSIIENLGEDFTFARFKEALKGGAEKTKATNVYDYFEQAIEEKKADPTKTTYKVYQNALSSLKKFRKTKPEFKEIDVSFLNKYKEWFLSECGNETSLSMYLRTLRTVLNMAIDDGLMKPEQYPFGKGRKSFKLPTSRNVKKALTLADIKKIAEYQPKNEAEAYHRDIWLFSYLCNGMNIKDIALLRNKDIRENGLVFTRAKTKDSAPNQIFVPLLPQSKAIIERWGNPDKRPDKLIFDLIPESTPKDRFIATKNQRIKVLNKYMGQIFANLELGTYDGVMSARHSFATVMKRSGASVESISEALGHSNIKTTANYLDSFEDDAKIKMQNNLVNF